MVILATDLILISRHQQWVATDIISLYSRRWQKMPKRVESLPDVTSGDGVVTPILSTSSGCQETTIPATLHKRHKVLTRYSPPTSQLLRLCAVRRRE